MLPDGLILQVPLNIALDVALWEVHPVGGVLGELSPRGGWDGIGFMAGP